MEIKTLKISNFKGISEKKINFSKMTTISGENGTGKTTIADAWFWLMSGKDSMLTDNPSIVPIGATECNPTVEAALDVNGKAVNVCKKQIFKDKDGKQSTTNKFFVNDVPMTERDFLLKLSEYGIDDRFLAMSHPDFLLRDTSKKGRDYVRNNLLFPMAKGLSDKEIAKKAKLKDLEKLLDDYTLTEIEAMNKATLKRINDEIGKDNVIANARIDELSKERSGISAKDTYKALQDAKDELNDILEKQDAAQKRIEDLQQDILSLTFDRNAFVSAQNDQISHQKIELDKTLAEEQKMASQANNEIQRITNLIEVKQETVASAESRLETLAVELKDANQRKFSKKLTTCPTCGQQYPAEKAKHIEEAFNASVAADKNRVNAEIAEAKKACETRKAEIANLHADRDKVIGIANSHDQKAKTIEKQIAGIKFPKVETMKEYKAFEKQISAKNAEIDSLRADKSLREKESDARAKISELKDALSRCSNDDRIDERIKEIREEIKNAEVNRANAEKVLFQIEQLSKSKNELLEESINEKFSIVKWKLFRTLKNGSVEDACIPVIDGYEVGTGKANKGREILAKIDIISGLAKHYGNLYPIFLDNAESLSEVTEDRIKIDNQLVMFKVTEDKELEVK